MQRLHLTSWVKTDRVPSAAVHTHTVAIGRLPKLHRARPNLCIHAKSWDRTHRLFKCSSVCFQPTYQPPAQGEAALNACARR